MRIGKKAVTAITLTAILASGCATPITTNQKQELQAYKAKGLAVEEKTLELPRP